MASINKASYPKDVNWDEPFPVVPLFELFDQAVSRFRDRPCIDFLGQSWSYDEIGDLVNRAAAGFKRLGVEKGVKVGLCLPNTPYFVICYYAALKAGGTVVNYNPLDAMRELANQINDSETVIMVTLDLRQIYRKLAPLLERTALEKIIICCMGDILPMVQSALFTIFRRSEIVDIPNDRRHSTFAELTACAIQIEPPAIDPKTDIAVLQYTGGTTGAPKGAMLTNANLVANAWQVRRWFYGMDEGAERILGVLPLFHAFAMTSVMNLAVVGGAEMILLPRFEIKQTLAVISKKRPTLFPGVPTIFTAINLCPDADDYDLSSIKYCISGGAPLSSLVKRVFEDKTGCVLVEGYGLSEASPVVACNPINGQNKEGSVGLPMPGAIIEIRDMSDPSKILGVGEKGEICVAGPQVMAGYWKRPEATARDMVDGRLRTGDIGYMDADGYTFIVDRLKDLILCGGYNVYPHAIEEAVRLHPMVEEVTVIGVADDYRGQTPKAFVKLRNGQSLTKDDLLAFLKDQLSPIEMPEYIEFRDALPKTAIGKLSKKELIAEEEGK